MDRTAPAVPRDSAAPGLPAALPGLLRAESLTFGPGSHREPRPEVERYFRDLAGPYDTAFRGEAFTGAPRNSSTEMAAAALDALGPLDAPVDLALVAYAAPDWEHASLVAPYLNHRIPGEPLSFAVSDQGVLAPFTALRVAAEYARRSALHRVVLLVIDQRTQPFVRRDAAVALLLECHDGAAPAPGLGVVPGVAPGDIAATLADRLPDLFTGTAPERTLVVAGSGIDPARDLPAFPGAVTRTEPGRPCTGGWAALLDVLAEPEGSVGPETAVLVEYDRALGDLAHCTLDLRELRSR